MKPNSALIAKVMARYRQLSYGLIAKELGISRNVVAGIVFRANHPPRARKPGTKHNMTGAGHRGRVPHAAKTLFGAAE